MNANHHQPVVVVQKETVFLNNVLEEAYQIRQQQREYNREIEARCNNLIDLVEEYRNRMAIQAIQNIEDNSGPLGPPQPEVRVSPEPIPVNVSAQLEDLPTVAPIPSTFDPSLYITATTSAQTVELSKQQQNYTQIKEENDEVRVPTELIPENVSANVEDISTDNQIPLTLVPFMSTAATTSTKTVELSEQLQNDIQIKEEILEKEVLVPSAQGLIPLNMEIEDFPTDTQIPSIFDPSLSATTSTQTVELSEKPQNDTQIKKEVNVSAETPLQNVPFPVQQTSSSSISLPIVNQTGISTPPNNVSSFSETVATTTPIPNPIQNSMSAQIEYVEHQDSNSITITTITTTMPIPTAEITTEYNNGRSNAQNMLVQMQQERKQKEDNMKWDTFASCVIAKQQRKQRNNGEDDGGGQLLDYPKSFNIPNNFGSISSVLGSAPLMIQPEDNGPPPPPQPPTKRPRGRPKKYSSSIVFPTITAATTNSVVKRENDNDQPNPSIEGGTPAKRGRGRPRKVIVPASSDLSSI